MNTQLYMDTQSLNLFTTTIMDNPKLSQSDIILNPQMQLHTKKYLIQWIVIICNPRVLSVKLLSLRFISPTSIILRWWWIIWLLIVCRIRISLSRRVTRRLNIILLIPWSWSRPRTRRLPIALLFWTFSSHQYKDPQKLNNSNKSPSQTQKFPKWISSKYPNQETQKPTSQEQNLDLYKDWSWKI